MLDARLVLSAALLSVSVGLIAYADETRRAPSDFQRRALVEGSVEQGTAYAIPLSGAAGAELKRGRELRVFDAAGREVPSLVHTALSRSALVARPVRLFDRAWTEAGVQTLSIELAERELSPVNEFEFEIADAQYVARVRVESSVDGARWQIVRDGLHLIRHAVDAEDISYRHDVLRIPTSRARFFRFTLRTDRPAERDSDVAAEAPLDVRGVSVRERVSQGSVTTIECALEPFDDPRDDDPRHDYWKLDLGVEDLGIEQVRLSIPELDYSRRASLWVWSEERSRRTRQLASTVLFRYGDDVHTEFSDFVSDARVLVLRIDQGDDAPIAVSAAHASRPHQDVRLVAPEGVQPPLALYFTPVVGREPHYDIARYLREHEIVQFADLKLAALADNPDFAEPVPPRSEQIPYLLYLLVVPLIAALGYYVIRTIQAAEPPDDAAPRR